MAKQMRNAAESRISATRIDDFIYKVEDHIAREYGCKRVSWAISPLTWYIPRSNIYFLRLLLAAHPSDIAEILVKNGSIAGAVQSIKNHIGYHAKNGGKYEV